MTTTSCQREASGHCFRIAESMVVGFMHDERAESVPWTDIQEQGSRRDQERRYEVPVITYRQALNEALREEMDRDKNVFCLGEEIGRFGGSYRVTEGLLDEFGPERILGPPISELRHHRPGHRRRYDRASSGGGDHDHQLHHGRHGSAGQQRCEDPVYVRR